MSIAHHPQRLRHSWRKQWQGRYGLWLLLYTCFFWFADHPPLYAAPPTPMAPTVADSTPPNAAAADTLQRLNAAAAGTVSISVHPTTGAVRLVRVSTQGDLLPAVAYQPEQPHAAQVAAKSIAFFTQYGALFGLGKADDTLKFSAERRDAQAFSHLTYQQHYQNVPVFGGILRTHFDAAGNLTAVNGVAVPVANVDTTPRVQAPNAAFIAIAAVQQAEGVATAPLSTVSTQLYIFQPELLKGRNGPIYLAYRIEVVNDAYSVRRFVFVDAHTGKILLILSGIHELEREVSEGSLNDKVWDEGSGNPDPIPAGWAGGSLEQITAWNDEIAGAKETYNLFGSMTNGAWLSYNGQNATMRTVNNDPTIQCPNANWNSISTNYCDGVTGDDTVAHEWGHAYTEYTSNLLYVWQPGALNEAYSDIWGEVVDLLNARGTDSPGTARTANSCSTFGDGTPKLDNTYRWLSGEDDPKFGGAIRDMWQPTCYGHPGKVTDTEYTCGPGDNGGVHSNSGVPNHLFALLVDGGAYNNITVNGIGLVRASHIHWQAQSAYLTEVSDFFDHADALTAACSDLIGQPLYALSTTSPTGTIAPETITAEHCTEVAKAITAVELRTPPSQCDLSPLLDPVAPPLCTTPTAPTAFHQQNWENGLAGWSVGRRSLAQPGQFNIPNWSIVDNLPDARSGQAAFGPDPVNNGDGCETQDQSGVNYLQSPVITIPAYATAPRLAIDHWVATEAGWDGGNLKIRVNNGLWTIVAANALTFNSYNGTLITTQDGFRNTNPLAGEPAFSGSNNSSVSGSWGQTQVNLSNYARPGDKVELRFELGFDGCSGLVGWYVDDVRAYACTTPPNLGISQQATPTTVLPGQTVTYQLTLSNPDALPATTVVVTDVLPAALTVNSFSAGGTVLAQPAPAVRWSLPSLDGATQRIFTVTATVSPTVATDLTLTNMALVTASNDASANNNTATSNITITPPQATVVSDTLSVVENAGQFSLTITLNTPNPYAPVQITYTTADSSATAGADYPAQNGVVTIAPGATKATITLTLLNDGMTEPEEQFRILLSAAGAKIGQNTVTVLIVDDDIPGLSIKPRTGDTGEDGTTVGLQAMLTTQPAAPVTVTFTSSDLSEGVVTPQLLFTGQNWNVPQSATVTGVDDLVDDGDILYHVSAALTSLDPAFAAVTPVTVTLTNRDNEVARLTVTKTVIAPAVTLGSVVTYSYAITNSGNVTISNLNASDDRLGTVPLTSTILAPNTQVRSQLTHVLTIADLPILVNQVTATGVSMGGNTIVGTAQAQVNLLDVELGFTKTVGIAGITPPCAITGTLPVPVGTVVRYCYHVENRGSVPLSNHTLVDDHLGSLLTNTAFALAPGTRYTTNMTATLGVSTTNVATWTSSFLYTTTLAGGEILSKLLTISKHDAVTVTVASATADQDGDTIPDNVEGALDLDKDNLPNFLDTDADNDGLSDQTEAGPDPTHPRDGNGNGIPDYLEAGNAGGATKRLFLPLVFR